MNNEHSFYSSNGKRGGLSEEELAAAGIEIPAARSQLRLENQLQALLPNEKFLAVMKDIYQDNPDYGTACDRLEAAITKAAKLDMLAGQLEILSFETRLVFEDWEAAMTGDDEASPMGLRYQVGL